jgi:hypothetical protein
MIKEQGEVSKYVVPHGVKMLGVELNFVTYMITGEELNKNLCLVIKFTVSWCCHTV